MKKLHLTYLTLFLNAAIQAQVPVPTPAPANAAPAPVPAAPPIKVKPTTHPDAKPVPVPANDPFARQPGPEAPSEEPSIVPQPNLITVVETWSLATSDLLALLDESPNGALSYDRVRELAETKKANLDNVVAISGRSGNRSGVAGVDEVRYPAEFQPPAANDEIAFPQSDSTKNTGDQFEFEPQTSDQANRAELNFALTESRLSGIKEHRSEPTALPAPMAEFDESQIVSQSDVRFGETRFLGTLSPSSRNKGTGLTSSVAFLRMKPDEFRTPIEVPKYDSAMLRVDFMLFTMDRKEAQKILLSSKNSAEIYAATKSKLGKKEAELERANSITLKSGIRGMLSEHSESAYSEKENPPTITTPKAGNGNQGPMRSPASPTTLTTRNTGLTLAVEPQIESTGSEIIVQLAPEIISVRGSLAFPQAFERYPKNPVFESRKIETSICVQNGQPGFVGTMNPPRANGVNDRKDSEKTSLAFVRATRIKP